MLSTTSIGYDQFGIDPEGKMLLWTPGDKKIAITATRGRFRFLALSTLATRYGGGGTNALRRSLGLTSYRTGTAHLSSAAVKALRQEDEAVSENVESMELENLSSFANSTLHGVEKVGTTLTTDDTAWPRREHAGLAKAMTGVRDELVNNLSKLSDVDDRKSKVERHLVREHQKMTETNDTEIQKCIRDRIRKLESDLSDIELERQARLEALSTNRAALRSQINRIRETFRRLLHEDITLAEHFHTLFREQGIIASILTRISMAISTLVLALTGGAPDMPSPTPKPSGKDGVKEWVKKTLQALGHALANLAGKAAAALPGIIGSIVSLLLSTLRKTVVGPCCGDPVFRGCSGLAMTRRAIVLTVAAQQAKVLLG